jgi:intracellular septation protein
MVSVVAALAVSFAATRRLPVVPLATAVLAVCFGALTLYLQDTTFIKMKVTVIYALFGAALFAGLAMNRLFLPFMFNNAMALTERGWRLLTVRWGAFFFALAILNEIVWRTQSNDVWVAFKFPGIFIILALFMLSQAKFIMRHQLNGEEAGKD